MVVRAKKHLGQHFLKEKTIAKKIVDALTFHNGYSQLLEIGPGTGILTEFLDGMAGVDLTLIDIDTESIDYLKTHYPHLDDRIIDGDFLKINLTPFFTTSWGIIGNFPYNISSQIFFRVLEERDQVQEVVCMLQKEVAERICSGPGSKIYGILSVLLQAYYDVEYLFTVKPGVFNPPPKVNSGVIRLRRNNVVKLDCDEKLFFRIVKQGFQNRRKTLRNALKPLNLTPDVREMELLDKRAEQLFVDDFIQLTQKIEGLWTK